MSSLVSVAGRPLYGKSGVTSEEGRQVSSMWPKVSGSTMCGTGASETWLSRALGRLKGTKAILLGYWACHFYLWGGGGGNHTDRFFFLSQKADISSQTAVQTGAGTVPARYPPIRPQARSPKRNEPEAAWYWRSLSRAFRD